MSRLVPHPWLSLGLLCLWLLLTAPTPGHLILGSAIALIAGRALAPLEPETLRLRNPGAILKLAGIVTIDIVRSNAAVAWLILTNGRSGHRRSGFVRIPLRAQKPETLAVLALIVTATPGTAWLEHDPESGVMLLHVFDLLDEAAWQDIIRNRYEALLLEIFE